MEEAEEGGGHGGGYGVGAPFAIDLVFALGGGQRGWNTCNDQADKFGSEVSRFQDPPSFAVSRIFELLNHVVVLEVVFLVDA